MGVPTSEVGYTSAMPRREYYEVHKDMWGIGEKINRIKECLVEGLSVSIPGIWVKKVVLLANKVPTVCISTSVREVLPTTSYISQFPLMR